MNKLNLANQITTILELNSYDKRAFLEDISWNVWLENADELSILIHTHLILSHSPEQLRERLYQDILKLEAITKLLPEHEAVI